MSRKFTVEEFVNSANQIHNYKYDYSKTVYVNALTKVIITCPIHGDFMLTPNKHSHRKCGCPKCGKVQRTITYKEIQRLKGNIVDAESFIRKSKEIHGTYYDYSLVSYVHTHCKVELKCPVHGVFLQTPSKHLIGYGCRLCGYKKISQKRINNPVGGWSHTKWIIAAENSVKFDAFKVYVLECWNETERFYKIGKTFKTLKERFRKKSDLPYNWKSLKLITGEGLFISKLEILLKNKYKKYSYVPKNTFHGMYECFSQLPDL